MTLSEILGQLLGWVGDLVEWVISFVPRYEIIRWNQAGVRYARGTFPSRLGPGLAWYIPALTDIQVHYTNKRVLNVADLSLETADGIAVQVGMVCTYKIVSILKYEADNYEAEDSMSEAAQAAVRDVVMEHTWEELAKSTEPGSRLEGKLRTRLGKVLDQYGVEVIRCRPTDQVRLRGAFRVFGIEGSCNEE